jgi:hypothetical protein
VAKHTGLRARIIEVLKKHDEMYAFEIAKEVNQSVRCVSNALFLMDDVYRIKEYKKSRVKSIYSLKPFEGVIEISQKPKKEMPKRYVSEFKPMAEGGYNLYEGRNLAMLAR